MSGVDPSVTPEDLDIVPTQTLWRAIERRTSAALLVIERRSNRSPRGTERDEREVSFHGGLSTALGLAEIARDCLLVRWRRPDA